ncbi:hypothetical protein P3S68_013804 [Capsicum galapagoense]
MNKNYALGKSKRKISSITYSHHLRVEIDLQLGEPNSRFDEVNTDLLLGMASLSPDNSFVNYDKNRIIKLATYYPNEFSASMLEDLSFELDNYIDYVRQGTCDFFKLKRLGDLSETLVKNKFAQDLETCIFACEVDFDITCGDCNGGKSFLFNEIY